MLKTAPFEIAERIPEPSGDSDMVQPLLQQIALGPVEFSSGVNDEAEPSHDVQMQTRVRILAHIEMTATAAIDFAPLAQYAPRVTPSRETYAVPDYLSDMLTDNDSGIYTYTNTVSHDGWQQEVRSVLEDYLITNPTGRSLVDGLGITSLNSLTPEQAVKLSTAFVQSVSKYSRGDVRAATKTRADESTAIELLREGIANKDDPQWSGNGVCRNIASNVKAVFEALKATQADMSMLRNTYAVYGAGARGAGYDDKREDPMKISNDNSGHAWNTFITIDAQGSALVTIADATWALGKDASDAIKHIDRTDVRAAAQVVNLFEKSERKAGTFEWVAEYFAGLARRVSTDARMSAETRENYREYAVTEYLRAAVQLAEIPDDHRIPDELMSAAYRSRGKLDPAEIETLFRLDKAGGSLEEERLKALIKGYDGNRKVPLPAWRSGENLTFKDDELQQLAYDAVGEARVRLLAEDSGAFRMRLRQLHPELLPPFNPYDRPEDAHELSHMASRSGIHDRDPKAIMRSANRMLRKLAGNDAVFEAITTGRSDYELIQNLRAITSALRKQR